MCYINERYFKSYNNYENVKAKLVLIDNNFHNYIIFHNYISLILIRIFDFTSYCSEGQNNRPLLYMKKRIFLTFSLYIYIYL